MNTPPFPITALITEFTNGFTSYGTPGGDDPIGQLDHMPYVYQANQLARSLSASNIKLTKNVITISTINPNNQPVNLIIERCELETGDSEQVYVFLTYDR